MRGAAPGDAPTRGKRVAIVALAVLVAGGAAAIGFAIGRDDGSGENAKATHGQRHTPNHRAGSASISASLATTSPEPTQVKASDYVWPRADDRDVFDELLKACDVPESDSDACEATIRRLGGTQQAADLYRSKALFVTGTYPAGVVTVGFTYRVGANYSTSPIILDTSPSGPFVPDLEPTKADKTDPTYAELRAAYRGMLLAGYSARAEMPAVQPDGSVRITYQTDFVDGCNACEVLGVGRIPFTFAPDGSLADRGDMSICGPPLSHASLDFKAPTCPAATLDPSTPTEPTAETPKDAVKELIDAWWTHDPEAATEIASKGPIDFVWREFSQRWPPSPRVNCWVWTRLAPEYACSLGDTKLGITFAVVGKAKDGYFVASAGYGE
jgi:hypothetical protein